jgi:hypothetical protein
MTDDDWKLIVKAWAAWVSGEGPMVQGRKHGCARTGQWVEWDDRDRLDRRNYDEWRVRPPRTFARLLKSRYGINHATKLEGEPDPIIEGWCKSQWIGEWQEVPE